MPDHLEQARRFRERAAECEALADACDAVEIRKHYRTMGQHYLTLAETEQLLAKSPAPLIE